ncbi:Hvo_1808 family surface protein [Halorhabdus salina]|uniref:Hvo_1808 family surface protein n=1 Tax=Halorhabdus salina TaxID=2750670 RepID=UPI0015EFD1D8|nr:Hvo_1808 family surface protein [Halorhabdus salina]
MTRLVSAAVVLVVGGLLVVGAGAVVAGPVAAEDGPNNDTAPPDPETDVIGWEHGYWYNESIDVDQSDGLTPAERERVLARTMARVEYLRGLEFTANTSIEFVTRDGVEHYVDRNVTQLRGDNATWEALFIVGEDEDARTAVHETILASVGGMAAEEGVDHIVLLTPDPDRPKVSEYVLAHELVHVLQDQHFDLSAPRYQRQTLDGELAKDGLIEGEASLVDGLYRRQCAGGEWDCLTGGLAPPSGDVTPAIARLMGVPYQEGATYVQTLRDRGGWDAVTGTHQSLPRTMEPVIHPERNVESAVPIEQEDRSGPAWQATGTNQRIGEVGIRLLFEQQNRTRNVAMPVSNGSVAGGYASVPADGWGNDTLRGYTNGSHTGYVWETTWDTRADAREFATAYRRVLESYDATQVGEDSYVIPRGPYADAFAVVAAGSNVTIVNAPGPAGLTAIDRSLGPMDTVGTRTTPSNTATTTTSGPGFDVAMGLAALLVIAVMTRVRRPGQ